ncbi:MAG TPA: hypothetical protein PLD25_12795 [Chloroflexota bacterium]|nr:hypothetical protein [Chloroflexota bacterium]
MNRYKPIGALLLMLLLAACGLPGRSGSDATATPVGNFLRFSIIAPAYTISMNPGGRVPGAPMEYLGQEGDTYRVRIGGQEALKRVGDSFAWSGVIAPGVFGEYNLRLTSALLGPLPVTGGVTLTVLDWQPVATAVLPQLLNALYFSNILLDHNLAVGETMPASTLKYEGQVAEGSRRLARFSGLTGLTDYAQGDSVTWIGQLRPNVNVRYNLRVISFDEDNVLLGGTAELWLAEPTYPETARP